MNLDFKHLQENSKISCVIKNNPFLKNIDVLNKLLQNNRERLHYKIYNKIGDSIIHNTGFLKRLYVSEEIRSYLVHNEEIDFESIRIEFNNLMYNFSNINGFYEIYCSEKNEIKLEKCNYSFSTDTKIYRYSSIISMFAQDNNRNKELPYIEQLQQFPIENVDYFLNNYTSHYIYLDGKYIPLNNKDIIIKIIEQIYYNISFNDKCQYDDIMSKYNSLVEYMDNYKKETKKIKVCNNTTRVYIDILKQEIINILRYSNDYIELDFSEVYHSSTEFYAILFLTLGYEKNIDFLSRVSIINLKESQEDLVKMAMVMSKIMLEE